MSQTTNEYRVEVQRYTRWEPVVWPSTKEDALAAMQSLVSATNKRVRVIETRTTVTDGVVGFATYTSDTPVSQ